MPLKLWISREEEAGIPDFKSYEEAREYFKEKYGDAFQLSESLEVDGEQVYLYMHIVDKEKFNEMQEYRSKHNTRFINAGNPETKGFMESYQSIQVFEDGRVNITH
ncbi:hypothetical protein [Bacillus thuringiensis]|uniref:hypothetical protein n=1 Tax=Bacillus thuringiensis TaxID=1428 RepID=UPI000CD96DF8|nr:hypothetical protein [Bacillus thuringiensis]